MSKYQKIYFLNCCIFLFLFSSFAANAQEEKQKNWMVNGYVKNMQTAYLNDLDNMLTDNLVHNRINFKWFINDQFTFKADFRNRILYGTLVQFNTITNPDYRELINNGNNDFLNLSTFLVERNSILVHSMVDRVYLDYSKNKLEVRLGRQRINWGINTVWNPNDIFNAYSFFDFDYEERTGSDALRIQYYTGAASSIEVASNAFDSIAEAVIAGLWKFNKWNYDFQFLGGIAKNDYVLGTGWAGNIKNIGFKGEVSFFRGIESEENAVSATLGFDYSFKNSFYLNLGGLYNSSGAKEAGNFLALANAEISAKNLYPYQYAIFNQISYPISPLLNASLATIYSPNKDQALFLNPSLSYSIKENWYVDLIGQLFFANDSSLNTYELVVPAVFLRLKWSY